MTSQCKYYYFYLSHIPFRITTHHEITVILTEIISDCSSFPLSYVYQINNAEI